MLKWRLLDSGYGDGAYNMALDESLLGSVACEGAPTTLRLYGWRPATVSLGYFQGLEGIDRTEIKRCGFALVRRPTGGRAILHDDEVTYSICIRQDELKAGHRIMASYRELCGGLEAGLRLLGIEAGPARRTGLEERGAGRDLVANCFARAMAGDLVAAGHKIVGSAQMRRNGAILQHGSVPITISISDQMAVMRSRVESGAVREVAAAAGGLAELLGRELSYKEVAAAIAAGFAEAFGVILEAGQLSQGELEAAEQLRRGKYATDEWNLQPPGRRPGQVA